MTQHEFERRLRKILDSNIKEIPYEGKEINTEGIITSIMEELYPSIENNNHTTKANMGL